MDKLLILEIWTNTVKYRIICTTKSYGFVRYSSAIISSVVFTVSFFKVPDEFCRKSFQKSIEAEPAAWSLVEHRMKNFPTKKSLCWRIYYEIRHELMLDSSGKVKELYISCCMPLKESESLKDSVILILTVFFCFIVFFRKFNF